MQESKIDFKKLRLQISLKYGIELDETSLAVLGIMLQEMRHHYVKINKGQEETVIQVKQAKKALQVDPAHPRWQAFWHGMGQFGFGLCLIAFVIMAIFLINLYTNNKQQETEQTLVWYKEQYEAAQKKIDKVGAVSTEKKTRHRNK